MSRRIDRFGKPAIFRSIERGKSELSFSTGSVDEYATNIRSNNSFRYEPYSSPLKSTQQLSVDFSKFENHTFFNSAAAKVSVAFNKIINKYPFDSTRPEIEEFEDKLTGYEKYILDIFPKHTGYITLSGSSYIDVKNIAGVSFPEYSSLRTAKKVLDPGSESLSIETFLMVPNENNVQNMGLFYISGSDIKIESYIKRDQSGFATASFVVTSGSFTGKIETNPFSKGEFHHISFVVDRDENKIRSYVDTTLQQDSQVLLADNIYFNTDFSIGKSGTDDLGNNYDNISGSLKDFRIYHQSRNEKLIKKDYKETVYKNDNLKLNFRFNEPTGSYSIENYVIDTSGNSLHSPVQNFDRLSKIKLDNIPNPVSNENKSRSHILFPDYYLVTSLNSSLLTSGSQYDKINPNLITNLIPPHYFEDAVFEDGNYSGLSSLENKMTGDSIPGSAGDLKTGLLTILLLSWANIFDEIKMFIDSFGNVIFSDYHDEDIVPDQIITFAAKHLGVDLPPMFTNDNSEKYFDSKSIYNSKNPSTRSLKKIQSLIWKRILADSTYYKRTKGTIESLKTIFRSSGIEPDKMFAFIEKGSNTIYISDENNEQKFSQIPVFNFSGSLSSDSGATYSSHGFLESFPHFKSSILSGSKYDNNFPKPVNFQPISEFLTGSTDAEDGMFTSGSWTYEGYYKFDTNSNVPVTQSLARIHRHKINTTDYSLGGVAGLLNIIALKDSNVFLSGSTDSVIAYFTEDIDNDNPKNIVLDNVNIFNGDLWYVSFSKERDDDPKNTSLEIGNKYTLSCGKYGSNLSYTTSSYFTGSDNPVGNRLSGQIIDYTGSFIAIGSQSLDFQDKFGIYSTPVSNNDFNNINYTTFSGKIGSARFWSKSLTEKERESHQKNIDNIGVDNPNRNITFKERDTFEIIRLNINGNQQNFASSDGLIYAENRTQKEIGLSFSQKSYFSGFESNKDIVSFERFRFLSPPNKIDEINSTNKIRINSLERDPDLSLGYQFLSPVYQIENISVINDDARFSIEMSIARMINDSINNEISTVRFYEDILGRYNNIFSQNYSDLDGFSREYFKNHENEADLNKLMSVYTWLESSFEEIIENSLPKKTKFLGMNYVIEPHNLERSRVRFGYENAYMGSTENNESRSNSSSIRNFNINITNRHWG